MLEMRDFLHGFQAWKKARFMHDLKKNEFCINEYIKILAN